MSGYTNVTTLPLEEQEAWVLEALHHADSIEAADLLLDKLNMIREAMSYAAEK